MRPEPVSGTSRAVHRWVRDLHMYFGLLVSPFVLVYAVSTVFLNHAFLPWGGRGAREDPTRTVRVSITDSGDGLVAAKEVQRQVGVRGEIGFVSRRKQAAVLTFPIDAPGVHTSVRVDLATGTATVQRRKAGIWDGLVFLHKMPGPHNADIRGNWLFTRLWGWVADATVYLLLLLTITGFYLWTVLKADRRAGLLCLGGGVACFTLLLVALIR
jgi:hypothetical protein